MHWRGGSKHIRPTLVEGRAAFRITGHPIQFAAGNLLAGSPVADKTNVLYLIIGALIVGIGVLGYNLYQEKKEPQGLQINVGPDGLKVQNK